MFCYLEFCFEEFCVFLSRFGGILSFLFCSRNHFIPFIVLKNFVFSDLSPEGVVEKCCYEILFLDFGFMEIVVVRF